MSKKQPWDNALVKNLCVRISTFDLENEDHAYHKNPIAQLTALYAEYSILNKDKQVFIALKRFLDEEFKKSGNNSRDSQKVRHNLKLLASRNTNLKILTSKGNKRESDQDVNFIARKSCDRISPQAAKLSEYVSNKIEAVNRSLAEVITSIEQTLQEALEKFTEMDYTHIQNKTIGQFLKLLSRHFLKRASIKKSLQRMKRINDDQYGRVYDEVDFSSLGLTCDEETGFNIISREISLAFYAFSLTKRCGKHPFTVMEDAVDFLLEPLTINYGEQRALHIVQEVFARVQQHVLAYESYDVCPPPKSYILEVNDLLAEQANAQKTLSNLKKSSTGYALVDHVNQSIKKDLHAKETQMISTMMPNNNGEIGLRSHFVQACYKKLAIGSSIYLDEKGNAIQLEIDEKIQQQDAA